VATLELDNALTVVSALLLDAPTTVYTELDLNIVGGFSIDGAITIAQDQFLDASVSLNISISAECTSIEMIETATGDLALSNSAVIVQAVSLEGTGDLAITTAGNETDDQPASITATIFLSSAQKLVQRNNQTVAGDIDLGSTITTMISNNLASAAAFALEAAVLATQAIIMVGTGDIGGGGNTAQSWQMMMAACDLRLDASATIDNETMLTADAAITFSATATNMIQVIASPPMMPNWVGAAGGGTIGRANRTRDPETVIRVRVRTPDDIEESRQYTYKTRRPIVVSAKIIERTPPRNLPSVTLNAINLVMLRSK
jgi:hypothetical protein